MEDGRFDGRKTEEAVVQHLLEDFEVAEQGGGRRAVAVHAGQVGV